MKLTMMRGLPASGKSTAAKELCKASGNTVRVNRDLLREMLHFGVYSGKNEATVVDAEKEIVALALLSGSNVVVDDCNLNPKNKAMWKDYAKHYEAKFEVKEMDTPYIECMERDLERDNPVGTNVIFNMATQYGFLGEEFYDQGLIVVDLDGTVADCEHRRHHLPDWKKFFADMDQDTVREDVVAQIKDTATDGDHKIMFVSARPEDYREVTEKWIQDNLTGELIATPLLMRRKGDKRPDTEVKQEIYDKFLKQYPIACVFDDRPSVIKQWRSNGLTVHDVGNGIDF